MTIAVLDELSVSNLGLIAEAAVEPGPGLVVITGETGTGKTLLLGALRLLRGESAAKDLIGPLGDDVTVAGRFFVDGEEMVLSRRVTGSRSRAYRDGAMVPARSLAEAARGMIEIVGQHDHLSLTERSGVRTMIDGAMDTAGKGALAAYQAAWDEYRTLEERRRAVGGDRRGLERERDVVRYQADEIAAAGFGPGDDTELDRRADRLRNSESLVEHLGLAAGALGEEGASANLAAAGRELELAARIDPSLRPLADQLADVSSLLGDLVSDVASTADEMERDPGALQHVEQRLAALADLRRKYGEDLAAVLEFGLQAAQRADELESLLEEAAGIDHDVAEAGGAVRVAGAALAAVRRETANRVQVTAVSHLKEMGLSTPVVRFVVEESPPAAGGCDTITLEFASDEALAAGPAGRVASGGELSRLVLALRLATGVAEAPVIAFDEIDAGVGGATALAVGAKLAALAEGRQVLCVTHLPQVAAHAETHLVVTRQGASAAVTKVDGEARLQELTRMLSGLPDSDKGKRHAAELLALAGRRG
jgi:DNA repair protein RecN (Recombination protein N)